MLISEAEGTEIRNPETVADITRKMLMSECEVDRTKEHFWVAGINKGNVVIYLELVSLGILDSTAVHPREVFRTAVMKGVACVILIHNHPSGQTNPSRYDIDITEKLKQSGKILGIPVLDHVIITLSGGVLSFKEKGLLND